MELRRRLPTSATPFDGGATVGDSLRLRRQPRFCPNETEEKEYLKILTERMRVEDDDMDSDTAEYIKNLTEQMRVADAARDDRDIASYERMQRRLAACGALPPPTHRIRKRKHRSICINTLIAEAALDDQELMASVVLNDQSLQVYQR